MARSRMIRPEFWDDEKLSTQASMSARLIFIGLWNHSDDYGVVKGNPIWLKNHILPYNDSLNAHGVLSEHSVSIETFYGWLLELEKIDCIIPFNVKDENYYYIRTFTTHQKINRPSKQRNPSFELTFTERSVSPHDILTDETEVKQKQKQNIIPSKKFKPKIENTAGLKSGIFKSKKAELTQKTQITFQLIKKQCQTLSKLPKKEKHFDPIVWAYKQYKEKKHPEAILKTLDGIETYWSVSRDVWAYCNTILDKVNGNFNEADAIKIHDELKNKTIPEFKKLTEGLFEGVKNA